MKDSMAIANPKRSIHEEWLERKVKTSIGVCYYKGNGDLFKVPSCNRKACNFREENIFCSFLQIESQSQRNRLIMKVVGLIFFFFFFGACY